MVMYTQGTVKNQRLIELDEDAERRLKPGTRVKIVIDDTMPEDGTVEQHRQAALHAFLRGAEDSRFRVGSEIITRENAHR